MRRANDVIGLPLRTSFDGVQIGTISDVAYAPERDRVVGFLVDGTEHDALPFEAVREFTDDAAIVADASALVDHEAVPMMRRAVESSVVFDDLTVVSQDGTELGTIEDTFFDERTGQIVGFDLNAEQQGGILGMGEHDQPRDHCFLPVEQITDWNEDHMRVTCTATAAELYRQPYPQGYDEERAA